MDAGIHAVRDQHHANQVREAGGRIGLKLPEIRNARYPTLVAYAGIRTRHASIDVSAFRPIMEAIGVAALITPERHREHIARADRHIAELRRRISHQLEIVERLRSYGISHEDREDLLATLGESLRILQRHRELIREALQRAE